MTAKGKKRRKKKTIEQTAERTIDGEKTSETFWLSFCDATEDKLTAVELEDLAVEGGKLLERHSVNLKLLASHSKWLIHT